jgi:hypothetical protein
MSEQRTCRKCGCTDANACILQDGGTCHWVAPDLCSACAPSKKASVAAVRPEPRRL